MRFRLVAGTMQLFIGIVAIVSLQLPGDKRIRPAIQFQVMQTPVPFDWELQVQKFDLVSILSATKKASLRDPQVLTTTHQDYYLLLFCVSFNSCVEQTMLCL